MEKFEKYALFDENPVQNALSISQMQTFLRCRKQWEYSYIYRIMPRIDRPKMTTGKIIHSAFASAWLQKAVKPSVELEEMLETGRAKIREEFAEYMNSILYLEEEEESLREIETVALEVFNRAFVGFRPHEWEPVISKAGHPMVEVHFLVPCVPKKPMQGYVDLVARNVLTDQVWQIDYKFMSTMGDPSDEMFNVQNPVYQYALDKMGVSTVGSLTFFALNKGVTMPNINKNGTISRAKINCDWESYARFCAENGQDPANYEEEMVPKLSEIEWFRFNREYRNAETIKKVWKEIVTGTGYEITKKQTRYPRNISHMTCRMCQYQQLCHAEIRGYDTDFILKASYQSRDKTEEGEET